MSRVDELNPKWVKDTLLAILSSLRKLSEEVQGVKYRLRKVEIGQDVMLNRLHKMVGEDEKHESEIVSLSKSYDRHEERIVRLEEKVGISD